MESMEQRTEDWLSWRKKGIGSSDAPIIMGVSPWKTRYQLWLEKTDQVIPDKTSNWAQQRGNEVEPIARAKYEIMNDCEMGAALCVHQEFEFMKASMDGWNPVLKRGLEIKFVGANDFELARNGGVPDKYWPQIQHQIMVTGAIAVDYFAYYVPKGEKLENGKGICIEVKPDLEYIAKLAKAEVEFWDFVKNKKAPPLTDDDLHVVKDEELVRIATRFAELKDQQDLLSMEIKECESYMLEAAKKLGKPMLAIGPVRMTQYEKAGSVDMKLVPQLKGVDLEPYRKPATMVWRTSIKA